VKVARTVLRGEGGGDTANLLDTNRDIMKKIKVCPAKVFYDKKQLFLVKT